MNILFISDMPFPLGMAGSKRTRLFAEYLAINNNVKVFVVGPNNGNNGNEGVDKNIIYKHIKFSRIQNLTAIFKIKKILKNNFKNNEQNVLFFDDGIGLTNLLFVLIGKRLGFKIVTDIVEDYSLHKEDTGFLLSILIRINIVLEKLTYKFADGVVVISSRLKKKFINLRVKPNKLEIICISAENLDGNYEKKKNDPSYFQFVYSGSYGNKDGIEILILAFKELLKGSPNTNLFLAGKITEKISKIIENETKIKYVGMIPDNEYYQFLNSADALLMTRVNTDYANTGFPFKLGEYLATGKPVIATRVSDIEMYLKDKEDVLLAEPSDVNSLVESMKYAYTHPIEIEQIGIKGKEKCKQFFNPEINGKKLEQLISTLFINA